MNTWTTGLHAEVTFSTGDTVTVPAGSSVDVKVTAVLDAGAEDCPESELSQWRLH